MLLLTVKARETVPLKLTIFRSLKRSLQFIYLINIRVTMPSHSLTQQKPRIRAKSQNTVLYIFFCIYSKAYFTFFKIYSQPRPRGLIHYLYSITV